MQLQLRRVSLSQVIQNFIFHIKSVKIQGSVSILYPQKK